MPFKRVHFRFGPTSDTYQAKLGYERGRFPSNQVDFRQIESTRSVTMSVIVRDKETYHQQTTERMNKHFNLPNWSVRQKLALTCRILAAEGHDSGLAGQATARGEKPGTYYMLRFGLGFDEITAGNLLLVDDDLNVLEGVREWLSPEQRAEFDAKRYFDVIGCDGGKRYRIHYGATTNVHEIGDDGLPLVGWCFLPKGPLVAGDVMLAQKIALETYECSALAVANRFPTDLHTFR
jgi:hypothetical protein